MRSAHRPTARLFIATFAIAGVFALGSCSSLGGLGELLSPYAPKIRFEKLDLRGITFQDIDVDFVFAIDNPNPLNVKLDTFSYALGLAGTNLVKGTNTDGIALKSKGTSKMALPLSLKFTDIFKTAKALGGKDEIPFQLSGDFGFNTPAGMAKIPFNEKGNFPVVKPPKVSMKGVRMGKVNLLQQKASMNIDLGFKNELGGAPISLSGLDYNVKMGGKNIADGLLATLPQVAAGTEQTVTLPINLDLGKVGSNIVSAITKGSAMDIGLGATVQVGTPFGAIPLSIDENGNFRLN